MYTHPIEEFEFHASPPSWYEVAKLLREQAEILYANQNTMLHFTDHQGKTKSRSATNRGVFLLAGFSIENLLKAFIVYEKPNLIANGALGKSLRTHSLSTLWQQSAHVPYKKRFTKTACILEEGLESWARYPCGLTHQTLVNELVMTRSLWSNYNAIFTACSRRLEALLTRGWINHRGERHFMRYESIV